MTKTQAHLEAEHALPAELRDTFNALVADYKAFAKAHTGKDWVNYNILSDLIHAGWRKLQK